MVCTGVLVVPLALGDPPSPAWRSDWPEVPTETIVDQLTGRGIEFLDLVVLRDVLTVRLYVDVEAALLSEAAADLRPFLLNDGRAETHVSLGDLSLVMKFLRVTDRDVEVTIRYRGSHITHDARLLLAVDACGAAWRRVLCALGSM